MDKRTLGERVSDNIAHFGGSWKFIFIFSTLLFIWILFNSISIFEFDKYPFILLNLVLSFIAAFQAPFIMMSQNRAEAKQDASYKMLLNEIKELVQKDLDCEIEIHNLGLEIKAQQYKLFMALQEAINLEKLTREDLSAIFKDNH